VGSSNDTFRFMTSSFTYNIIWTHNSATQSISSVVVAKHSDIVKNHLEGFWEALQAHSEVLKYLLYSFVALYTQIMDAVYSGTINCQAQVSSVEVMTGFSPIPRPRPFW
jgi:hypothetical protein